MSTATSASIARLPFGWTRDPARSADGIPAVPALVPPVFAEGSVWLVGAGPGDPGLLTLHAVHALQSADLVLHDALVAPEILALVGPQARLESVGKRSGRASHTQIAINQKLIVGARRGLRVLRLKGGDPLVFGRGGEEALALAAAGIPFRIVPGISAGIGGTAYAGLATTHRTLGHTVAFATGHPAGAEVEVDWEALARAASVLVLYMALGRIGAIARRLVTAGRSPDEPVAFVTDGTTARQQVRIATLAEAETTAAGIPRDAATLIVVGPVVDLRASLSAWQESSPMGLNPRRGQPAANLQKSV